MDSMKSFLSYTIGRGSENDMEQANIEKFENIDCMNSERGSKLYAVIFVEIFCFQI